MASEMYKLITKQVDNDSQFATSLRTQGGALSETKSRQEHNMKRAICIGGSLSAVVVLIILMTGMGGSSSVVSADGDKYTTCGRTQYVKHDGQDFTPSDVSKGDPNSVPITNIGEGLRVADIGACQAACDASPDCNAASFYKQALVDTHKNCYLKNLGEECISALPDDATVDDNAVFLTLKCGDFTQHTGMDYIPAGKWLGSKKTVSVKDIGDGMSVYDVKGCEEACSKDSSCNAASFYNPPPGDSLKNCFLKALGDACSLPSDTDNTPNATLLLKCDQTACQQRVSRSSPGGSTESATVGNPVAETNETSGDDEQDENPSASATTPSSPHRKHGEKKTKEQKQKDSKKEEEAIEQDDEEDS